MRDKVDRGMRNPNNIPPQVSDNAIRIPSTGLLQPVPTRSGDLLRPQTQPQTTQQPTQDSVLT